MSQLTIETFHQHPAEIFKLNEWIFDVIQPFAIGRILEMDSGSGDFSSLLIERGIPVHLSDIDKINRDKLRLRFKASSQMKSVNKVDFLRPDFEQYYSTMLNIFSTIVRLNITEHGFPTKKELENANRLLRKNGHIIVTLPSYTVLFPGLEHDVEALKRYNRRTLKVLLNEFKILKTRYFNLKSGPNTAALHPISLCAVVIAQKL
jgi:SAM-dependent methyltransferase